MKKSEVERFKDAIADLEIKHNVYIEIINEQIMYNRESRDAIYGWYPIPNKWFDLEYCEYCDNSPCSCYPNNCNIDPE